MTEEPAVEEPTVEPTPEPTQEPTAEPTPTEDTTPTPVESRRRRRLSAVSWWDDSHPRINAERATSQCRPFRIYH